MKISHVHCRVRDLPAAVQWFDQVLRAKPSYCDERMAAIEFGEFTLILDASAENSPVTIGFDSDDCDADYRDLTSRGAESSSPPQDQPWGARAAYFKGPGALTIEIEQMLS